MNSSDPLKIIRNCVFPTSQRFIFGTYRLVEPNVWLIKLAFSTEIVFTFSTEGQQHAFRFWRTLISKSLFFMNMIYVVHLLIYYYAAFWFLTLLLPFSEA